MNNIMNKFKETIKNKTFIHAILSNRRTKDRDSYSKIDIKPVVIQDKLNYQLTYFYEKKVYHENLKEGELLKRIEKLLEDFRQFMIYTSQADLQVLISKRGKVKIIEHKASREKVDLNHDRKKQYILNEGEDIDFLKRLGVMNKNGKVLAKSYDKFRQINRFLELIEDGLENLDQSKTINIVDFGCGKSYLTFALYYYLVDIRGLDINIVGLDLKEDVINFCNQVAEDLDYENLSFKHGDIVNYEGSKNIDMVVTLHACDIATDAALVKAVNWQAKLIYSVPCCQHEFYNKIENLTLNPMLKHGIIRENLASLVTDSLRGNILEILGYNVQLVEFIDMEHTPKNILIRAYKDDRVDKEAAKSEYLDFKKIWGLEDIFIEKELEDHEIKL